MKEIIEIRFNWFFSPETGEECEIRKVGALAYGQPAEAGKVTKIKEHPSAGDGDDWYYDIEYENGAMERTFNPNRVFYNTVK